MAPKNYHIPLMRKVLTAFIMLILLEFKGVQAV